MIRHSLLCLTMALLAQAPGALAAQSTDRANDAAPAPEQGVAQTRQQDATDPGNDAERQDRHGSNRGYVVGSSGVARAAPPNGSEDSKQERQGNNRGYVVGKGGVARAAPPSGSEDSKPPEPATGQAPIGVSEPGVNRAPPQSPIGINEPGINRGRPPQ